MARERASGLKKVLVVGQTPPPYGGQAVMIERLLQGSYKNAKLVHVRMAFAKDMDDMGRFRPGKLLHLLSLIAQILRARFLGGADILYFPPSGPDLGPLLRDLAILVPTRWLFRKTIFHFHAAGTSEIFSRLPIWLKPFYRLGYGRPDLGIRLSEFNPNDPEFLDAKCSVIVPNGIEDDFSEDVYFSRKSNATVNVLFVGLVTESKGVFILVEAAHILKQRGVKVSVTVVGKFASEDVRTRLTALVVSYGLSADIEFTGVLTGEAKFRRFYAADIFCFPTFFESESFGLVVAEGMQFKLPVVVSRWRGVQSVVRDGETGFLVPPHNAKAVADRLQILVEDPGLRVRMGERGREVFLNEYTLSRFQQRMDECFRDL